MTVEEELAAAENAVEQQMQFITRFTGIHGWLYGLEELIVRRTVARLRALPGVETMTALQAADAIDPELAYRARQTPCTVVACPRPEMRILIEDNGNTIGLDVRPGDAQDRVDTVLLTTDDKLTIRYGLPPAPGQEPVGPPVPGRGRLLAHIRVPAGATVVRPDDITTYPWEA